MKSKPSQTEQILEALRQGRELTPLEALREFGCFRLGARIWDLTQAGYEIDSKLVHQNGKHYASYKLIVQRSDASLPEINEREQENSVPKFILPEDEILELQDTIERLQSDV